MKNKGQNLGQIGVRGGFAGEKSLFERERLKTVTTNTKLELTLRTNETAVIRTDQNPFNWRVESSFRIQKLSLLIRRFLRGTPRTFSLNRIFHSYFRKIVLPEGGAPILGGDSILSALWPLRRCNVYEHDDPKKNAFLALE